MVRLGLHRVPLSYHELYARSTRLSRALFEPLLYIFFLACFIVMLQLLPTLRSYGERASIAADLDNLFAKGSDNGVLTTNGYGPRGLGRTTPGLCPPVALWEVGNALVDTERITSETQKAWQWSTQVSRVFHRPTRCVGCSFDDFRLHDSFLLYSSWLTMSLTDGEPRNELGDTDISFGIRFHQSLGFDFTPHLDDLTGTVNTTSGGDNANSRPLSDWDAVDRATASELNWDFGASYGWSIGGSNRVQAQIELLCASGEVPDACEVARRRSTSYHNMHDLCAPIDSAVMGFATQGLANDTRCATATSVSRTSSGGLDECPMRIGLRWHMLLREVPQSERSRVDGSISNEGATYSEMASVDETRAAGGSTDSLWVLVTFDGSTDAVSYTFLPVNLYPGAQGVALGVFQVVFCFFTLFFLFGPIFGRLCVIERGLRGSVQSLWWRTVVSFGRAFSRKWFWFDLLTLGVMIATIILYGVYVDRHKALSASCEDCLDLDADVPMGAETWDNITEYCCGNSTFATCETFEVVLTPFCCATAYGNCFQVCSDEQLGDLVFSNYAPDAQRSFLRDSFLASALNGEEAYYWDGTPWLYPRANATASPLTPDFDHTVTPANRSCVQGAVEVLPSGVEHFELLENVTWCGFTSTGGVGNASGGCICDAALCYIYGNCCDDIDRICGNATQPAMPLPEGWKNVSWPNYINALLMNYRLSAPIGDSVYDALISLRDNQTQNGLNFSEVLTPIEFCEQSLNDSESSNVSELIHDSWNGEIQEWADRVTKPYESYSDVFEAASSAEENFIIALAFCAILVFSRSLRYAHIDIRMSLLLRTLKVAAGTLCFFLITGALLFMGYVFFAQIYNGFIMLEGYTTFFGAFTNTFNLLFDPFPGENFPSASRWPFWVWYFVFMILITIICMNLVVAILVSAFELVRDFAAGRGRGQHTIGSAFVEWRALQRATRYKDGKPDMAAVYAFYSKRDADDVVRSAVMVQSHWRGLAERKFLRAEGHAPLPPTAARRLSAGDSAAGNAAEDDGARRRRRVGRARAATPLRMLSRHPAAMAQVLDDALEGDRVDTDTANDDEGELPQLADMSPAAMLSVLSSMQRTLRNVDERTRRLEEQAIGPTKGVRIDRG